MALWEVDMVVKLISQCVPKFLSNEKNFSILLDTGAYMSVFTKSVKTFEQYFKAAYYSGYNTVIGGFGGKGTICPVYVIPEFSIGCIRIVNLPIAIQYNNKISSEVILASHVFGNTPFTVDYSNRELLLSSRNIRCRYKVDDRTGLINGFISFTQEELI